MYEITKADWKLFRERIPMWQEQYMEKLNQEYIKILSAPGKASDHFWELEERIKRDKKHPGVLIELRRSQVIFDTVVLVRDEVITMDDLLGFSEEFIDAVKMIIKR